MGSSSGLSSNSSGPEGDLQQLMDQRKRKRMISNRESARRSRLRKQKHLDGLTAQAAQLRSENHQILKSFNDISEHYLNVEAENLILRARIAELSHRLESLKETANFVGNGSGGLSAEVEPAAYEMDELAWVVNGTWNCFSQPALVAAASADTWFQK